MAENASMSTANVAFSSIIFMLFVVVDVEVVAVVGVVLVVVVKVVIVVGVVVVVVLVSFVVVCGPQLSGFRTSRWSCMTKSCWVRQKLYTAMWSHATVMLCIRYMCAHTHTHYLFIMTRQKQHSTARCWLYNVMIRSHRSNCIGIIAISEYRLRLRLRLPKLLTVL